MENNEVNINILGNISYEKYNRNTERGERSPNKKIQVVINKNNVESLQNMYEVLDSSDFGFSLRCKRIHSGGEDSVRNKIKVQIDTHKNSNVILQVGVDGLQDSLIINPKAVPYQYRDDETIVVGDFTSESSGNNDDDSCNSSLSSIIEEKTEVVENNK